VAEKAVQGDQFFEEKSSAGENEYLYNRKEFQEETAEFDYGSRFMDPIIGRFTTIDPKAEVSRRFSPYTYGDDNSIRNIDPDGMETEEANQWPPKKTNTAAKILTDSHLSEDIKKLNNEASQVFSGSAEVKGSVLGASASVTAGPLTLKAGAGVLNGSVGTDGKAIKLDGSVAQVNGQIKFGSAQAQGALDLAKGKLDVPLNQKPISGNFQGGARSGSANAGNLTLDNSLNVGAGANISIIHVEGNVSLYRVATTLMATGTVVKDVVMDAISNFNPFK
jgi:RHS repeat-associated protein